jgi:hypothetical protein
VSRIDARFEFRCFDAASSISALRTVFESRFGPPTPDSSRDIYLVTREWPRFNVKLRQRQVDVKALIEERGKLQRWQPILRAAPPLNPEWRSRLLEQAGVPRSVTGAAGAADLLGVAERCPEVFVAHTLKRRWKFGGDGLLGEVAELRINGAAMTSVALEGPDPDRIGAAQRELGLSGRANLAFPAVLQQLFGLTPLPAGHPCRIDPAETTVP